VSVSRKATFACTIGTMPSRELDSLRFLVVVDNETDALSSVDGGVPQIPELSHLLASTPASRTTSEG